MTCDRGYFEKHIDAAFATPGSAIHTDAEISGGEIAHIYGGDSSHAVLARADASQATDKGME